MSTNKINFSKGKFSVIFDPETFTLKIFSDLWKQFAPELFQTISPASGESYKILKPEFFPYKEGCRYNDFNSVNYKIQDGNISALRVSGNAEIKVLPCSYQQITTWFNLIREILMDFRKFRSITLVVK